MAGIFDDTHGFWFMIGSLFATGFTNMMWYLLTIHDKTKGVDGK